MAEGRVQMPERWSYDVFLNFRGKNVREGFVSHLYSSLRRFSVRTFMDEAVLEKGDYIPSELLEAIETSKILVVVLSKDYASSTWCLNELLQIMKCRRSNSRQLVFPIFYYIDPSDIRRQRGTLAESFCKHDTYYPVKTVQGWREALTEVANLSGWDLRQWNEAKCIEVITKDILRRLPSSNLHVPSYAVGIISRLERLYELMSIGSDDVQVIGIYGMGGIGKTMLAKAAYNEFAYLFEGTSFLENLREHLKKPDGKARVQMQLLSDILKTQEMVFNSFDFAVKERFRSKRVLVVIDDVDDMHQLNSMAIDPNWFGPGSRIIITTRNMRLLEQLRVEGRYSPRELDKCESLELLSWHAFRTSEPPEQFLQSATKLVEYCAGLPLAVEVFGSFLLERSIPKWESTLELLKRTPDDSIQAKLRISFDALNSVQKDIFLDIACFFIGMDRDYVACILEGCKLFPEIGLSVLLERCLITVNDSRLMMHDLLRDMGRQIVREESPNNCGKRSRLWDHDDVLDVLTKNSATDKIQGLSLKTERKDPGDVNAAVDLDAAVLSNMQELRLLQLSYVNLRGSYEHLPKGLRWLSWHGFPLKSLPTNFSLGYLVVMDMQHSNLTQLWDAQLPEALDKLKYLDLSHSADLEETPNFSYIPNLETLLLKNCKSLVRIHTSIGLLHKKLVLVNLKGCSKLEELPRELYQLKSLETLNIASCLKLEMLDDALGEMESLTSLIADYTALREVPSSIIQLKKLKELSLRGCKGFLSDVDGIHSEYNPPIVLSSLFSLNGLNSLRTLCLGYCNLSDQSLPDDLGCLSCLEELDLGGNSFCNMQTDFSSLPNLQKLNLTDCSLLKSMCSLPKSLREFNASYCISLVRSPDFSQCLCLETVYLTNCLNLVETPGIDKLTRGKRVSIYMEFCENALYASGDRILQGWVEKGNGDIYLPGSTLANWVIYKDETDSVSFTVPETLSHDPLGFTVWMRTMSQRDDGNPPTITVKNQTKGNAWPRDVSNEYFHLERGDQVEVNVDCTEQGTVLETGIALRYRTRDFLDINNGEAEDDELEQTEEVLYFCGDNVVMYCKREKIQTRTLSTTLFTSHLRQREGNNVDLTDGDQATVYEELYVCGVFLKTSKAVSKYRRTIQQPTVETHHRPRREMRVCLRTFAGFLEFCQSLFWDNYGEPLRRRRLRHITGGKFIR